MNRRTATMLGVAWMFLAGVLASSAPVGKGEDRLKAGLPTPASASPVEIVYIPQEDFPRAPGYSKDGIFLPLSKLTALAKAASQRAESPLAVPTVACGSIQLTGAFDDTGLRLRGQLAFEATGEGWSAALIDDGAMPWTSQNTPADAAAFLARIGGRAYLFVKGPAKGTLVVEALAPAAFAQGAAKLSLGRFYAPCRVEARIGEGVELGSASVPAE
ncbi:MAG: hypothetical protein NTW86_22440, partial [Candidatus Sumerlaeota bacterium]|nr:hypothetical protein [Candidatus Sumerlaeota bacterium]